MGLHEYSDDALLAELVRRNPLSPGPNGGSRHQWPEAVIGIGRDETAYLTMHKDARIALQKMHPDALT